MAKWSLKKDQNHSEVPEMPPELSNYYREEKRDRMWGAWAIGFATLIVTIVAGVGLFLAGKWVVSQFTDDGEVQSPTTVTQDNGTSDETEDTSDAGQTAGQADESEDDTQVAQNGGDDGVVSEEAAVTNNLPDTGPGDTLLIFLAVVMLGTVGHSIATSRK